VADAIAAYNPHRPRPTDLSGLRKNVRQRPDGRWAWHWDPRFMRRSESEAHITRTTEAQLADAARAVKVPTLLIRGQLSDLLSSDGVRSFLQLVPHAELVDVAEAGHMIAGDRNDAFNEAVVTFMDQLK
jgi:pimeloyl-ACP methyl ester carboxylesterase